MSERCELVKLRHINHSGLHGFLRHTVVGQTAGPIGTKLGTRIHRDPASALGKSRLRSECRRRESGAAVGADSLRQEDVYYTPIN